MNARFLMFHNAAHPLRIQGNILEVMLRDVFIGEVCQLKRIFSVKIFSVKAIVIGFHNNIAILSMMGSAQGYSLQIIVEPTGKTFSVALGPHILGSMIDSKGNCLLRFNTEIAEDL